MGAVRDIYGQNGEAGDKYLQQTLFFCPEGIRHHQQKSCRIRDSDDRPLDERLWFTTDIILEACARTINQTGKPSFQYADGILGAWHKNGVLSFSDIQEMDVRHKESRDRTAPRIQNKTPNKFNNFHQRDYNFSDLEKQLLKK